MAGHSTTPTICVGPVRSHCTPISSTFCCAAVVPANHSPMAAPAASAEPVAIMRLMLALLRFFPASIRKRPHPEVTADVAPQPVEAFRLHDQEQDDQPAEHDQSQVGDDIE